MPNLLKMAGLALASFLFFGFAFAPGFDCSDLFFFKEGATAKFNTYDKDNELNGIIQNKYTEVKPLADGASATVHSEVFDGKGKLRSQNEFGITCKSGVLYFDFKSLLPEQNQKAGKDMEMVIEGSNSEFPSTLVVGQKLKDSGMNISYKTKNGGNPLPMMNMTMSITNRTVEARETVTTPAGTFDCYKITEDYEMKSLFRIKGKTINWFSFKAGMVKSESYKENGKFTGRTELAEFKN